MRILWHDGDSMTAWDSMTARGFYDSTGTLWQHGDTVTAWQHYDSTVTQWIYYDRTELHLRAMTLKNRFLWRVQKYASSLSGDRNRKNLEILKTHRKRQELEKWRPWRLYIGLLSTTVVNLNLHPRHSVTHSDRDDEWHLSLAWEKIRWQNT